MEKTLRISTSSIDRRGLLKAGAAVLGTLAAPAIVHAKGNAKLRIGYWPVASGLPFFAAVEKGYFKEAGVQVEVQKYAGAQQVMEAILAGRCDGSANGVGSGNLAIGELAQPGLFKIICSNPTNAKYVLDEIIVPKDSPIQAVSELKGKRVACGPGIQNVTIAKTILERSGAGAMSVTELPIGQHVAALAAGQVDAIYTLEPTGTVGRLSGVTRTLETGVVAKYILGDAMAPWFGGSACMSSEALKKHPELTRKYIAAYRRGVQLVKNSPAEARPFLKGYTAIDGALTNEVPMVDYVFYDEFKPSDIAYFQKYFDLFTEKGVFSRKLSVDGLLFKG